MFNWFKKSVEAEEPVVELVHADPVPGDWYISVPDQQDHPFLQVSDLNTVLVLDVIDGWVKFNVKNRSDFKPTEYVRTVEYFCTYYKRSKYLNQ